MNKIAAIDIGTNSMRLLLCEASETRILHKKKHLIVTRIGEGVSRSGQISEAAIERNIEALQIFRQKAQDFSAQTIIATATSAVRDAVNRDVFVTKAKNEAGIDIRVISGSEEAELGIIGVMSDIQDKKQKTLVIDIGGGSTELVLGMEDTIQYAQSIDAGTVRMTETYITQNPIPDTDIENLRQNLSERFADPLHRLQTQKIDKAICIGGTGTTIAAMYHELTEYDSDIVHNAVISKQYINTLFTKIKSTTIRERYDMKGLQTERADVIPSGIYILKYLLDNLALDTFTVSENDNLEGAVFKYVLSKQSQCFTGYGI